MQKFVTKKRVFIISLLITVLLLCLVLLQETRECYRDWNWCRVYVWDFVMSVGPFLIPFVAIFLISTITYKMRNEIFHTWLKFSAFVLPVVYFFIIRSPESAIGGGLSAAMAVTRGQAALQLSVIFLILSLTLITYKFFTLKKGGMGK